MRLLLRSIGPGVITGAADDDPSGIATYSVAGAQLGTKLLWTALLTWPLMAAVQGLRHLWDLDIIHQAQAEHGFALQFGTRTARGQHDHLPGPQGRQHPFDDVALGMSFAVDFALFIDFVAPGGDDLGLQRQIPGGQADAIELQLQVALAPEVAWILGRIQMSD